MANVYINLDDLKPVITQTIEETLARFDAERLRTGDRLAYSEAEAAAMLGLKVHQLRDVRLAGRIRCSKITCGRIRYTLQDLQEYLAQNRWAPGR